MPRTDHRRPPRYDYSEVVRVVACTGREVEDLGEPADASGLVGKELVVGGAVPTAERNGWLIGAFGYDETQGRTVWFAEDSLESTGLAEDWTAGDEWGEAWHWVPLAERDPPMRGWQDTVWVDRVLDWTLTGEDATRKEMRRAEALAEEAAVVLAKLVATKEEIRWTTTTEAYEPIEITLWGYPTSDPLAAYERIVAEPSRAWQHGENDEGFLCSSWETPVTERLFFLVAGVREAKVRLEYYSGPERLAPFSGF